MQLLSSDPPTEFQRCMQLVEQGVHLPAAPSPFLLSGWPGHLPQPWLFPIPSAEDLPGTVYGFLRSCSEHFRGVRDHSLFARWRDEVLPLLPADTAQQIAALKVRKHWASRPKRPDVEAARASDLLSPGSEPLRPVAPAHRRARHLVAMPVISTGFGGNREASGAVVRAILPQLYAAAADFGIDIALATNESHMYGALQAERLRLRSEPWPDLSPALLERARFLAEQALKSQLVAFIGAGSSLSCGLPSWWGLLRQLAERAPRPPTPEQLEALMNGTDPLAQGQALLPYYNDDAAALKRETARLCTSARFGLQHALLAAVQGLCNVVTTNYDDNFERAAAGAGRSCARLPYEPPIDVDCFLLKMHGCIRRPEDIVLTASDYSTYGLRREALAGIVQSLLITKHMLFVGFSLSDPNFDNIMSTVRRAIEAYAETPRFLGTSVQLARRDDLAQAYKELHFAWMEAARIDESARQAEIFLDCLAAHSSDHLAFLNAPMYNSLLSCEEAEIQLAIRNLVTGLSPAARNTRAYRVAVAGIVKMFGQFDEAAIDEEFWKSRLQIVREVIRSSS